MDNIFLIKFSPQEKQIYDYICSNLNRTIYWEELAQFSKNPQSVKLKSVKRTISELKKKISIAGLKPLPNLESLADKEQKLVKIKTTPDGNKVIVNNSNVNKPSAHIDFVLDFNTKSVKTKYGSQNLNDSEWEIMKYFHANVGKQISLSELRDKVVYPNYGSKLPARWFMSIQRTINNLRRVVPNLNSRLLTIIGKETSYLFK